MMNASTLQERVKQILARSSILVFFIMAFEVMIMISPFAFFFYSVFNPIFHWLNHYAATRWLTHFFLPHMILPPGTLLRVIRISGSVLFIAGALTFIVCALQVYLGKIFKWGIADKGLYRFIRHPQYLALGLWGTGMAILWPRFIVLATLSVMFILYYFLAKDEERRMTRLYGASYRAYMQKTGMFVPQPVEKIFAAPFAPLQASPVKLVLLPILVMGLVIGTGFILRDISLNAIPFFAKNNLTVVCIMPEDNKLSAPVINAIVGVEGKNPLPFLNPQKDYLGYMMPPDYIMQGMIANTGMQHKLYKRHHTFSLITDWVLHPFEHLRRPPSAMMAKMNHVDPAMARRHHCPVGINDPNLSCDACPYRRVIFVEIDHQPPQHVTGARVLSFGMTRTPVGFIDIDTRTGNILHAQKVDTQTAWEDVPTPAI